MKKAISATGLASLALLLSAHLAHGAAPISAELARCAGIAAPDSRLACYDALATRGAGPAAAASSPTLAGAAPAASAAPAPPSTAVSPPTAAPPPVIVEDPKNFGLSMTQQHVTYTGIKSEQARILSIGGGEPGQAVVVLDNGQTWKVTDDDGALSKGNQVTIKRASLGSFLMVAPSHHVYRVRRIG